MAIFRKGNMLNHLDECDEAFITTNSMVRKDGRLVMGRGIAQQARDSLVDIDLDFGHLIQELCGTLGEYHILQSTYYPKVWAFQVKYHWADKASLPLLARSVEELKDFAEQHDFEIFLNFPGIGNGQLNRDDVFPLIAQLPDNVTIWEL